MISSIYLRPLCVEDSLISYRWRNDPAIWKYTGNRPNQVITPEIEEKWLKERLDKEDQMRFAICTEENGTYVGNVQLLNIANGSAELHIFIGEKTFWGRNIGYEATLQVLKIGFKQHMLSEIYLNVHPDNYAARAIYVKAGFRHTKTLNGFIQMKIKKNSYLAMKTE
ncbi:MAG: N-acetyltransferase [Pedobacter sp.]|nr:MAG: N-acetyltransferase [Pedobacter sp.]